MPRGQIANDRVGLPKHEAIVLDGWHESVGIEAPVFRRVHHAEHATCIDALVWELHFLAAPENLLHIDRIVSSPDHQHEFLQTRRIVRRNTRRAAKRTPAMIRGRAIAIAFATSDWRTTMSDTHATQNSQ